MRSSVSDRAAEEKHSGRKERKQVDTTLSKESAVTESRDMVLCMARGHEE